MREVLAKQDFSLTPLKTTTLTTTLTNTLTNTALMPTEVVDESDAIQSADITTPNADAGR
jgi:hypothetical protein